MGKCPESLRPDHAKILDTSSTLELREDPVEDVAEEMAAEAGDNSLATPTILIRDPAENP
jgi:hypothetical protein